MVPYALGWSVERLATSGHQIYLHAGPVRCGYAYSCIYLMFGRAQ